MRSSQGLLLVVLTVGLAAVALFASVHLLAPRREEPPIDFAGLAVAAARQVERYGTRHRGFQHLHVDSVLVTMPPGAGLRISGDSTSTTVAVLYDGRVRCSIRVNQGERLSQPRCTER
jgi:hypothetical protein